MKSLRGLLGFILVALFVGGACAATTPVPTVDPLTAAGQVSVTKVTLDPEVLYQGDTGTISLELTNSGTDSVAIHRATFYDNNIEVVGNPYEASTSIGGGNRMVFTYTVVADAPEGIYYPVFSLNFRDAGSLRYPVKVQVENAPLRLSLVEKPDSFSSGKKETVKLLIGNPRDNTVNGINVIVDGAAAEVTPASYFAGNLEPDKTVTVPFTITPSGEGNLTFRVQYKNGINSHESSLVVPVLLSESKKQAHPVISNIQQKTDTDGVTHVTGDVTNAGLEAAKAVMITAGQPAVPVDPYKTYVVGGLEPDDFASFEITLSSENVTSIPVLVSYRDSDGNLYSNTFPVEITPGVPRKSGQDSFPWWVAGLVIGLAVVIGGIIWYSWRKR